MNRKHWGSLAAGLGLLLVLFHRLASDHRTSSSAPTELPVEAVRSNLSPAALVSSRGKHPTDNSESNRSAPTTQSELAAVADGEWILSFPLAEPQMALRALTNGGVPLDRAKGMIRPVLGYLYSAAAFKERVSHTDTQELAELRRIRESDDYEVQEKIGLMTVTAAASRASREHWAAQRDAKLEEFVAWVRGLGVSDPESLISSLLLIQPDTMPPSARPR